MLITVMLAVPPLPFNAKEEFILIIRRLAIIPLDVVDGVQFEMDSFINTFHAHNIARVLELDEVH